MTHEALAHYLAKLRANLAGAPAPIDRLLAETHDHLLAAAECLMRQGYGPEEAAREAVERFGAAEEIADQFARVPPNCRTPIEERMMKALIISLAGLNGLLALATTLNTILVDAVEAAPWWTAVKLASSAIVLAIAILTWLYYRAAGSGLSTALFVGGLALLVTGASGAVWTIHLAQVTGDMEAYGAVGGLLLVAQGAATTWEVWTKTAGRTLGGAHPPASM